MVLGQFVQGEWVRGGYMHPLSPDLYIITHAGYDLNPGTCLLTLDSRAFTAITCYDKRFPRTGWDVEPVDVWGQAGWDWRVRRKTPPG